ncbi:hypothetical protein PLICRDRAFT_51362 [Plicaturopsis crispa FD-325 SS-3]|nr:hypothetical protein PLICRDRAFT_51362 [Plicaturopsis crispa FD-325 SS-3]
MSSNIPTRRTTRTTRTATQKDSENANARPSRINTRAKPTAAPTRATAATAASRAKAGGSEASGKEDLAAHKRKREALGEVTGPSNVNKPKSAKPTAKGKDKETPKEAFDGVVLKAKSMATTTTTTTATTVARKPLRTVSGAPLAPAASTRRATRSTAVESTVEPLPEVKEEPETHDEQPMAVDDHSHARRVSTRRSVVTTAAQPLRRASARAVPTEEDAETTRVFKKRRTSSEAPPETDFAEDVRAEREATERFAQELKLFADAEAEADPNGDEWDDLDAEDADDPLMVSEYVVEIFEYMKEVEQQTMPNPNYMESQKELAWKMRGILTDWLVQVHVRFRLLPETLFLCVNIIDRFLSARVVSLAKLQLVGVTCMFIAAKVEEIVSPSVSHFLYCADSSYTESEILQAERYVLKTLEWNLNFPNPIHFLRRVSKADEYDMQVRTVAKYLMEIGCLEWRLIAAPPSLMAAAAIWLSRLVLGRGDWTPNLAHYSSYKESSLVPTANLMLNYILKPVRHESFFKKYAGKRYMKSSVFVRGWALERWPEGTQVALQEELPALKAAAKAVREAEGEPAE